jgi:hypothetical protein
MMKSAWLSTSSAGPVRFITLNIAPLQHRSKKQAMQRRPPPGLDKPVSVAVRDDPVHRTGVRLPPLPLGYLISDNQKSK